MEDTFERKSRWAKTQEQPSRAERDGRQFSGGLQRSATPGPSKPRMAPSALLVNHVAGMADLGESPATMQRRGRNIKRATNQTVTGSTSSASGPVVDGDNGLLIPMTLAGNSVGQAVYSIPVVIGHRATSSYGTQLSNQGSTYSSSSSSYSAGEYRTRSQTSDTNTASSASTVPEADSKTGATTAKATTSMTTGITTNNGLFGTSLTRELSSLTTGSTTPTPPSSGPSARAVNWHGAQRRGSAGLGVRAAASDSNYQTINVQVDLGSSDLWVASSTCTTSDCTSGSPMTYNPGQALDSGQTATLSYQAGTISGEIMWDEIQFGVDVTTINTSVNGTGGGGSNGFDVGFQAFIAADQVSGEDLDGGSYSGVLGLALPANSVISSIIPGSTTGQPDGATFLDNLFASGTAAPHARFFALSLERLGDPRTKSVLGIGMHDPSICLSPCTPYYSSIVSASTGPLFWRLPVNGISTTVWGNQPSSSSFPSNPKTTSITLPSSSTTSQSWPVGVLDSGGSQILFGSRTLLNAIYGSYNIGPATDGNYYVPCSLEIAVSLTFGSTSYAIHPLDMSDYMTSDASHKTCLGTMQYASGITAGDIALGSSFLKNVYSVYTYPSAGSTTLKWNPQVGLVSLTNATQASREFFNVRTMNLPLTAPSTSASPSSTANSAAVDTGHHVVSAGLIALYTILGTVGLAGGAFCAWFFWLRRKHGKGGRVAEPEYEVAASTADGSSARRSAKFASMQRQKSMVDGYSDFDVDSWGGETGTENSRGSKDIGELVAADEKLTRLDSPGPQRSRNSTTSKSVGFEGSYPPPSVWTSKQGHRDKSPSSSTIRTLLYNSSPTADVPMLTPEEFAASGPGYSRYASVPLPGSPSRKPLLLHGARDSSGSSAGDYFPVFLDPRRKSRVISASGSEDIEMHATERNASGHSKFSSGTGGEHLGSVVEDRLTEEPGSIDS